MTAPWPDPDPNPLPTGPHIAPVFPAAAPAVDEHPTACPCLACTDALLARLRRPLVLPGPRMDPALDRRRRRPKES